MTGIWDRIEIVCMNHEQPQPMSFESNSEVIKSPYLNCKLYASEGCPNRMNIDDYTGLVEKLSGVIEANPFDSFLNYTFSYKNARQKIEAKVIEYNLSDKIVIGIINTTILGERKL